jgi:membrane protein DedA with SNARE-associated domain
MLEAVAEWVKSVISTLGYPGIVLTMAIESALIPLPSEIIMPFSGFLVSEGKLSLPLVALSGAVGNVLGSLIAYAIGALLEETVIRRLVRSYGKWLLITEKELDHAMELLRRYNDGVVLGSRVLPGIRTVISLPCGMARLPLGRFIVLTFAGSLIWSLFLAYVGLKLGEHWDTLGPYFHSADALIVVLIVAAVGLYVYRKLRTA